MLALSAALTGSVGRLTCSGLAAFRIFCGTLPGKRLAALMEFQDSQVE